MNQFRSLFGLIWRSVLVGLAYFIGLIFAGMISAMLGAQMPSSSGSGVSIFWLFVSSLLLGLILCPLALHLSVSRGQHFILWLCVIFFNLGAVAIEGKFFVPELVPLTLPVLFAQQLIASMCAALVIALTCSKPGGKVSWTDTLRKRRWFGWSWRFVLSAASYLLFYLVFGALNYALVTGPYYESHAGGLTVPPPTLVLSAELVRAPLIILSILLYLLSAQGTKQGLMFQAGWILFAVGGIVPLTLQISSLPFILLFASAIEIFCQNFLTGMVSAWLLVAEEKYSVVVEGFSPQT